MGINFSWVVPKDIWTLLITKLPNLSSRFFFNFSHWTTQGLKNISLLYIFWEFHIGIQCNLVIYIFTPPFCHLTLPRSIPYSLTKPQMCVLFFFLITHWVLPLYSWAWSHSSGCGRPMRGYAFKGNQLSVLKKLTANSSSSARGGASWAPPTSMLECWWVYSCTDLVQVATAAVSEFVWVVVLSYPGDCFTGSPWPLAF